MRSLVQAAVCGVFLAGSACRSGPRPAPAIGEAYAGPSSLVLRQDLALRSGTAGTVGHGERLEIVQQRRRFYKVRTARGVEGWTDERMLLTREEMSNLARLSAESKARPSQGQATTFGDLNVHTEPSRYSPSFLQVKEGEKLDVIAHTVAPRIQKRKKLVTAAPPAKKKSAMRKEGRKKSDVPPPPPPAAPKPPEDWLELSKTNLPLDPDAPDEPPKPEPSDHWTLIRTQAGASGWVLTRRLYMLVPDEVAQYAEGHRIMAYFPLGEVKDGEKVKTNWLWATLTPGLAGHDFDSIRVFNWSLRRHRYETSFIERNLLGYCPIELQAVAEPPSLKGKGTGGKLPGFSILVEKEDGKRYRRDYALFDTRVRFAGQQRAPDATEEQKADPALRNFSTAQAGSAEKNLWARIKEGGASLRKRVFGK
jgi:hypothetical protein